MAEGDVTRCAWATREPFWRYHDEEWGTMQRDDRALFELLVLEGAQAGLSWETILRKRDAYRAAFAGFDPAVVAGFGEAEVAALLGNPGIVRNRAKIRSAIGNAQAFLRVQAEAGSFADWLWSFTGGRPVVTRRAPDARLPATTPLSDQVSAALRARGFRFVGSTITYSYLQATGVVDDHAKDCFRGR